MPVGVDTSLPWAPRNTPWDGDVARKELARWAGGIGNIDPAKMRKAFLFHSGDGTTLSDYKFPIAKIIDGYPHLVWKGVVAAAQNLAGARTPPDLPASDLAGVKRVVGRLYRMAADRFNDDSIAFPLTASIEAELYGEIINNLGGLVAAVEGDWKPDDKYFSFPEPDRPVPLQLDGDHIYGHLALWDTAHVGHTGQRVVPPKDVDGLYRMFQRKAVVTASGMRIPVGKITMDTGHAPGNTTPGASVSHYDNTGTLAALVTMKEGRFGPFFTGVALPTLTDDERLKLGLAEISGDWRPIGGQLQLVAALAVNTPGFPVPEECVDERGETTAVLAAGVLLRPREDATIQVMVTTPEPTDGVTANVVDGVPVADEDAAVAELIEIVDTSAPEMLDKPCVDCDEAETEDDDEAVADESGDVEAVVVDDAEQINAAAKQRLLETLRAEADAKAKESLMASLKNAGAGARGWLQRLTDNEKSRDD
jgi:hypothetical protein